MGSSAPTGWIVPKLQQRVLALPFVARSEKLKSVLVHPAGPFTSEKPQPLGAARPWRRVPGFPHPHLAVSAFPPAVHFWAPTAKWLISLANIADLYRPVEKMSVPQQVAITATGVIWSYYATQIAPVNYNLLTGACALRVSLVCGSRWRSCATPPPPLSRAAVNVFMGGTGLWHISRIVQHKWAAAGGQEAPPVR